MSERRVDYEGGRVEYVCRTGECQAYCGDQGCWEATVHQPDHSHYSTQATILLKRVIDDAALGRRTRAWAGCLALARIMIDMARSIRTMQK